MAIVHIANLRTATSIFDNQLSTGSFVALPSHICTEVILTVATNGGTAPAIPNSIAIRRGGSGGQIYVKEGQAYRVGVRGNSNEIQIEAITGTPLVGIECKLFVSGPPAGLP